MPKKTETPQPVHIVGICGSIRPGSYTRMAARLALDGAAEIGAVTRLVDLQEYDLVFCNGNQDEAAYPEDVFRLRREVGGADGLILATPEYHGGVSGVLKNALDLMGFDEFEGKMIGLIGVAGGRMGAANALNHLRTIGRTLHAWVVPEQISIAEAWKVFDDRGRLKISELENQIKEVGRQVARFAFLHSSEKAMEFVRMWEGATPNPGGAKDNP